MIPAWSKEVLREGAQTCETQGLTWALRIFADHRETQGESHADA